MMGTHRISIAGFMLVVAVLSVIIAAFRDPSEPASSALYTLAFGLNLTAVVAAFACVGRTRLVAGGFGIFGWGYFLHTFSPLFTTHRNPPLFTTYLINWVEVLTRSGEPIYGQELVKMLHALLTISFGLAGGGLAWGLTRRPSYLDRPSNPTVDQP